ncbi:MAG: ferritin family protein, partial [Gallionellaceae bacterium]|nr:ferritin family protein [Gallionellaceae bacterium]
SKLSLQDALDMAMLIEKEAESRYRVFAETIGERYPGDAAAFFKMMARNEQKHCVQLAERRSSLFGNAPSRITEAMVGTNIEAPELEKAMRFMSPRRALEVALESEIKAYKFYDQILTSAQHILDPEVKNLIKELRDEETEHQKLLNEMKAKYPDTGETDYDPNIDGLSSYHEIT